MADNNQEFNMNQSVQELYQELDKQQGIFQTKLANQRNQFLKDEENRRIQMLEELAKEEVKLKFKNDIERKAWEKGYLNNKLKEQKSLEIKNEIEKYKRLGGLSNKQLKEEYEQRRKEERDLQLAKARAEGKGAKAYAKELAYNINDALEKVFDPDEFFKKLTSAISSGVNTAISSYQKYQLAINTRLQGASNFSNVTSNLGSVAYSPLINSQTLYSNLNTLVNEGIVSNVEQRALLNTLAEGIASTWNANRQGLKDIIKLQQQDSTAARLGMESYLTEFLNVYVENTEYLTSTFSTVADSLLQSSTLLSQSAGLGASEEFEYVVQKWLGSLSGVGFNTGTATSIANALNALGTGNVESLNTDIQRLLMISASNAGLDYGSILNNGLDAQTTNELLYSMVEYMQQIANGGSNVQKSALANIFGINVTDLVAVGNLGSELTDIYNDMLSYSDMYGQLYDELDTYADRLGLANILNNLVSNSTFQTGMTIADNPVMYSLWKLAEVSEGLTGGIALPSIMGNSTNNTIEGLLKVGLFGASTLDNMSNILTGLGSLGSGSVLLNALGIAEGETEIRGGGFSTLERGQRTLNSGTNVSATSYVGNYESGAYTDSTLNKANSQLNDQIEVYKDENEDPVVSYLEELHFASTFDKLASNVQAIKDSVGMSYTDSWGDLVGLYSTKSSQDNV